MNCVIMVEKGNVPFFVKMGGFMKDMAHHRLHVQKKVIRDAKKETQEQVDLNHTPANSQLLQEASMSQDGKRKATRDFVRQMNQRDRAH